MDFLDDNDNNNDNDNNSLTLDMLKNMSRVEIKNKLNFILSNNLIDDLYILIDNNYVSMKSIVLHAIVNNNVNLMQSLMNEYPDIENINQSNDKQYVGLSILDIACQYGNLEMVQLLSTETDLINRVNDSAEQLTLLTPLHVAIASGEINVVCYLLDTFQHLAKVPFYKTGNNIVHLAIDIGNSNMLKLILQKVDIDIINHKNNRGHTPLHMAVLENDMESVKLLIEYNANQRIMDKTSSTPYELAISENFTKIAVYLQERSNIDNYDSISIFYQK